MKVLHLDSEIVWRGGQSQLFILIKEQLEQGMECHLTARPGSELLIRMAGTCPVTPVGMHNDADLTAALRIARCCAVNKIDIIHAHNGRSHALGLISLYFNSGPKLMVHRRVDLHLRKDLPNIAKYSNRKVAAYIAVSEAVRSKLLGFVDSGKITVIPDSMPEIKPLSGETRIKLKEEFCRELGTDPGLPIILAAGRLSPEKGHSVFLSALSLLYEQGIRFTGILAGEGPLRRDLEREIYAEGLSRSVFMAGFRNNIDELLQISDVYVMPSLSEGLGSGILEAFAAGTPVVASRTGGITELVDDEMTGLLFQPGLVGQAAEKIKRLLSDRLAAARMSRNAKERSLERHDPKKLAVMVRDIYQRALTI